MLRPPINFTEDGHVYRDSRGVRVPSVTQIMESAGLQDFSKVRKEDLEIAQERGTKVHHMCALYDTGLVSGFDGPEELLGYFHGWLAFREATGAVILAVERIVWHPLYGYVGTFDVFMEDKYGLYWLIDRKTGGPHKAHEVQLGAYWEAIKASAKEILPPDFESAKIGFASVHLKADGSYKVERHDAKKGWLVFTHCLNLYKWKIEAGAIRAA